MQHRRCIDAFVQHRQRHDDLAGGEPLTKILRPETRKPPSIGAAFADRRSQS